MKIQFVLAGVERTANRGWFEEGLGRGNGVECRGALAKDPTTMSTCIYIASGLLVFSTFPQNGTGSLNDSIVLLYTQLAGETTVFQELTREAQWSLNLGIISGFFTLPTEEYINISTAVVIGLLTQTVRAGVTLVAHRAIVMVVRTHSITL